MCDEMKLKHGVLWNSQTGKVVGLADDMLDLNSMMKRLLSDKGDVVKPVVYVNQWQYIRPYQAEYHPHQVDDPKHPLGLASEVSECINSSKRRWYQKYPIGR